MTDRRTLPHDLDAEKALIGAILVNNDLLSDAVTVVGATDFFRGAHRAIFAAMVDLGNKSIPIDLITIMDVLGDRLDEAGGPAYIASLTEGVPRASSITAYATIVLRLSKSRQVIQVSNDLMAEAYDGKDPVDLVDDAGQKIFELGIARTHHQLVPVSSYLKGAMELIERQANSEERLLGVSTGYHNLDKMLSGLQRRELYVVAGRPSMGKTALTMNICQNVAQQAKQVSAVFSLEMSGQSLTLRFLASGANVDAKAMMRGTLSEVEYRNLSNYYAHLDEAPIYIDETSQMTLLEMRAKCRSLKRKRGLDLVAIDYLQLMPRAGERQMENRNLEIGAITRGLKGMAKELDVPVMLLSQLSRENEKRKDKRPNLGDLRDSGSIEQDADTVLFVHREEMYRELANDANKGVAEIIIAKQRNGPIGTVKLAWIQEQTRFANITSGDFL